MDVNAQIALNHGAEFPYDASDGWWDSDAAFAPPAVDWAHRAARGVMADLKARRGIKWELEKVDEETRVEIVRALAEIIRVAQKEES